MKDLLIFDLDGVLIDAKEWHRDAFIKAYNEVTGYIIGYQFHDKELNALPTKTKIAKLDQIFNYTLPTDKKDLISTLKQRYTIEAIKDNCYPNYELANLLQEANSIYSIGCFTNSIKETTKLMLKLSALDSYIDVVLTNQDVSKPKPDPEGYIKIMNLFNCSPNNTIIIEDSPTGVEAAKASRAAVITVSNSSDTCLVLNNILSSKV